MIRRPPRSTQSRSSAASDVYKRQLRKIALHDTAEWLAVIESGARHDELETLAIRESHPSWIVRALREALVGHGRPAAELEALLHADNEAPEVTLVARPGLVEREELLAELRSGARVGPWTPTAIRPVSYTHLRAHETR